jgi:hypothetical protein
VDNFGIKYGSQEDVDHLISSIKKTYKLTKDWTGNLYCGITLEWNYNCRTVDILMPGYIRKKLQNYKHSKPFKLQNCPYAPKPKKFGTEAQAPSPPMTHQSATKQASNTSKKMLEVSYITPVQWIDGFDGTQFHCCGTNKSNGKDNCPVHPIIGLPLKPGGCKGMIPRFGYDHEYTFQCFIL